MQVNFLEKQYLNESTYYQRLIFKNAQSPLIIGVKYNFIDFFTINNKNKKSILIIKDDRLKLISEQKDLIQKILDENTDRFLIEIEKQTQNFSNIVENYKKISNGLCYLI